MEALEDADGDPLELVKHAFTAQSGSLAFSVERLAAWAAVESDCEEQVRLFFLEDFVLEPELAIQRLAQFLEVRALDLPIEDFKWQLDSLDLSDARLEELEKGLAMLSDAAWSDLEMLLNSWLDSPNPRLATLADQMLQRPAPIAGITDWEERHLAGTCDPCIFALRNACRNGSSCSYCHLPGHRKPKRASKRKRDQKKTRISRACRIPSPEWRSGDNLAIASVPNAPLPSVSLPSSLASVSIPNVSLPSWPGIQTVHVPIAIPVYWPVAMSA
jgi:hypothetical protein